MRLVIRLKSVTPPPAFGLPIHVVTAEEMERRAQDRVNQQPAYESNDRRPCRTDQIESELQVLGLHLVLAYVQESTKWSENVNGLVTYQTTTLEYDTGPEFQPNFQPDAKRSLHCLQQRFPKWITDNLNRSWVKADLWPYPEAGKVVLNLYAPKPLEPGHRLAPIRLFLSDLATNPRS